MNFKLTTEEEEYLPFANRIIAFSQIGEGVLWGREDACEAHQSTTKFVDRYEHFTIPFPYTSIRTDALCQVLCFLFSIYHFDYIKVTLSGTNITVSLYEKR